jgi:hypothetical protein
MKCGCVPSRRKERFGMKSVAFILKVDAISTLKTEAANFAETSEHIFQTTRCHIPQVRNFNWNIVPPPPPPVVTTLFLAAAWLKWKGVRSLQLGFSFTVSLWTSRPLKLRLFDYPETSVTSSQWRSTTSQKNEDLRSIVSYTKLFESVRYLGVALVRSFRPILTHC